MGKPHSGAKAPETTERYVKVTWSDDGKHRVEIRGMTRRAEVQRLLHAIERHCWACRMRGLPIDTAETQRANRSEEADFAPAQVGGERE